MGIPLWESPPKHSDKASASSRCNPVQAHVVGSGGPPRPSPWAQTAFRSEPVSGVEEQRRADWRAPGTFSGLSSRLDDQPASTQTARRSRGPLSSSSTTATHGSDTSSMLTLDEFLRETSQASAASNEAERHLQALLAIRRRGELARPSDSRLSSSFVPGAPSSAVAPPSPTQATPADSFDTLVGQIRRIGALQDFMLSSVDATTTSLENSTTANADTNGNSNVNAGGESTVRATVERDVASLRIREARLRAMQTRIDLLANEFALLRNTRRELRRVEAEALETLQNSGHSATAADTTSLLPERRVLRRAFLQQEIGAGVAAAAASSASIASSTTGSTATIAGSTTSGTSTSPVTTAGQRQPQTEQTSDDQQPTVVPRSVDYRTSAMTGSERDRLLRNAMMQMSIESLPAAAL